MSGKTWIIDSHLHLFKKATANYPRDCASFYPAERQALVDDFIEVMSLNNVRHAVIVPLGNETRYLTEILKAFPEKFSGIAVLDYKSQNPSEDIHRWKEEIGIKGIRIMGDVGDPSTTRFEDLALAQLLREMASLDLILWFYGSLEQLKLVHLVASALPEMTIVLNHLGFCQQGFSVDAFNRPHIEVQLPPQSVEIVEALAEFKNINVKFSGEYGFSHKKFPFLDIKPIAARILDSFGASRMLWASDWPWIEVNPGYESLIALTDIYFGGISDFDRQEIMGGNAQRLLKLKT